MKKNFPQMVEALTQRTLDGTGKLDPELRREVAEYTADLTPGNTVIPRNFLTYVSKVAMHSYKVTDADINRLKAAGYSEDDLYELTISAALGAGLARLNRGLELLKE
jgi:alkylhydroperoxidase family enzyme